MLCLRRELEAIVVLFLKLLKIFEVIVIVNDKLLVEFDDCYCCAR